MAQGSKRSDPELHDAMEIKFTGGEPIMIPKLEK